MGKVNFTIEKMKVVDTKEVCELGKNTKELQIQDGISQYYSPSTLNKVIKGNKNVLLVAKIDKEIAGFIMILYHEYFSEVYFSDIVVKKEYRKMGIGKALLDKGSALIKKRKVGWAWALVQEENKNMQKTLESRGFKKGKKFYFYYTHKI